MNGRKGKMDGSDVERCFCRSILWKKYVMGRVWGMREILRTYNEHV
jgi:hypothetical protein